MMSAVRRVHAATMGRRVVAVNRARVEPRRFGERGGEPEAPNGNEGTKPQRASHD